VTGTDEQLVIRAQNGSHRAKAVLVARYDQLATGIASQYFLAGGDRDDLRQEARIGLLKAVRDYRIGAGTSFKTFAALCALRQVITAVKTATRAKHRPLTDSARVGVSESGEPIEILDLLPSELCLDPYLIAVAREELERLARGAASLSDLERHWLGVVARGETVHVGGKNKTADNAIQRARLKLKEAA
jgi:RNA polymerase sporulation-specific sigma factor